jgi:hypothetical protein
MDVCFPRSGIRDAVDIGFERGCVALLEIQCSIAIRRGKRRMKLQLGWKMISGVLCGRCLSLEMMGKKTKTYNRRDSQMVTHSSTSRPVQCLCMAERTGCPVLTDLWSYVTFVGYSRLWNLTVPSHYGQVVILLTSSSTSAAVSALNGR